MSEEQYIKFVEEKESLARQRTCRRVKRFLGVCTLVASCESEPRIGES